MVSRETIRAVIQPNPERVVVRRFANICHHLASVYIKKKIKKGQLYIRQFDLGVYDLAWDCIAELFERDENHLFPELADYFKPILDEKSTEAQLTAATRRLVFSKVNDGLFRVHNTYDASLGKIIRNLKNAVQQDEQAVLDRSGEQTIIVITERNAGGADRNLMMPPELLEARLSAQMQAGVYINEVLEVVKDILRRELKYKMEYPLVELAQIIRNVFARSGEIEHPEYREAHQPTLRKEELQMFIDETISELKTRMYPRYVESEKLDAHTFHNYFQSIRDIMINTFVINKGNYSYYDFLKQHMEEVSKERYREHHRIYLEYLVKLVRSDLINRIRKEI